MRLWPVCILLECTVVILFYYLANVGRVGNGRFHWRCAIHLHRVWLWWGRVLQTRQEWNFATICFRLSRRSIRWGVQIGTRRCVSTCVCHFYQCGDKIAFLFAELYNFLSPMWRSMQYVLRNKVGLWTSIYFFCLDRCLVGNAHQKVL